MQPLRPLWRAAIGLLAALGAALALAACGAGPLLSEVQASAEAFQPVADDGQALNVSYRIGRDAAVDIYLENEAVQRFYLRRDEPRPAADEPYILRFDGTAPTEDPSQPRRLVPSGSYTIVVVARTPAGEEQTARIPLTLSGSDVTLPTIDNLLAVPSTISPNADAIDDVVEITYRLPVSATVDIDVTAPSGEVIPVVTRKEAGPYEQREVWNGKRPNGSLLDSGTYTYTVRAEDAYGNVVLRQGQIALADVGQPEARIVYASIAPRQVMLGEVVTVTVRVRNTGTVPIRTYGPGSGYRYTTDEVFSSVEGGRYTAQAGGFWRVGLDWDANSGGGPKRYPFRWAVSPRPPAEWSTPFVEDFLMPGEEAEIVGQVVILQRETRMGFYVGLIQDGVGFFQDRTGRTIVEVGL